MEKLLLRPREAAEALGLSVGKTYNLIKEGKLPAIRLDGAIRIPLVALQKMIAKRASPATSAAGPLAR